MASVVISPRARRSLERLIDTHSLPGSTLARFERSLDPLVTFPLLGAPLSGRWSEYRFTLGPWRWMIVVYRYDETTDQVAIVAIQDGREARAPTHER
jgi:plasmid stabilization system protein ParE